MRHWIRRLTRIVRPDRVEREMREEQELHLELEIADRIGAGVPPAEARRTALRDFGARDRWREEGRASLRLRLVDELRQDLRYATRVLRLNPGFALTAVATLTLAIGANTAVFSVVRGVLLRPLPYDAPEQLVRLYEYRVDTPDGNPGRGTISYLNFADLRSAALQWQSAAAYDEWSVTLTGRGDAERLDGAAVDWSWFDVLGTRPAFGRYFVPGDSADSDGRVIVLDYDFWQSRFGGDPAIVGTTLELNGAPHEVIGVSARGLENPGLQGGSFDPPVMWRPPLPHFASNSRGARSFTGLIRLRDGVTLAEAQAELDVLQARLVDEYPQNNAGRIARLVPLHADLTNAVSAALWLSLAGVLLVLLVACVNVMNLLLLRAAARTRELSLRNALGASGSRLARQLVTESLVIAMLGGVGGIVLTLLLTPVLAAFAANQLPRASAIRVDGAVLAFSTLVTLGVAMLFSAVPAFDAARTAPAAALRSGTRVAGVPARARMRHVLLGAQVGLCVLALVSAGLLTRTLVRLSRVDAGVRVENVLTLELRPSSRFTIEQYGELHDELRLRIGALPGVEAVGATNILPLSGSFNGVGYAVYGAPLPTPETQPNAEFRATTNDFFAALDIPLLAGRLPDSGDRVDTEPVVVVSRGLAERHFGTVAGAVGRALIRNDDTLRIVGVVGNVRHFTLDQEPEPAMYMAEVQAPAWMRTPFRLIVRVGAGNDALALLPRIRTIAREIDPLMPVSRVHRMAEIVGGTYAAQRTRSLLFSGFASVTLLLAVVGVYGTASYDIARRRQEIGVRLALGAERFGVSRLLLRQTLAPVLIGAAGGAFAAIGVGRVLARFLFGVSATDPATLAAAPVVLLLTAAFAVWLPVRRASALAPGAVLRED